MARYVTEGHDPRNPLVGGATRPKKQGPTRLGHGWGLDHEQQLKDAERGRITAVANLFKKEVRVGISGLCKKAKRGAKGRISDYRDKWVEFSGGSESIDDEDSDPEG